MMFLRLSLRKRTPVLLVFPLRANFPNSFMVLTLPLGSSTRYLKNYISLTSTEAGWPYPATGICRVWNKSLSAHLPDHLRKGQMRHSHHKSPGGLQQCLQHYCPFSCSCNSYPGASFNFCYHETLGVEHSIANCSALIMIVLMIISLKITKWPYYSTFLLFAVFIFYRVAKNFILVLIPN